MTAGSPRWSAVLLTGIISMVVACASGASNGEAPPGGAGDADAPSAEVPDPLDVGDAPGIDSGCPTPKRVTPANVPAGYLKPVEAPLVRTVDGDTARFLFPDVGEQIVRFLYVNTEEASGAEVTDFGVATAKIVDGWLRSAKQIVVAVRESKKTPGAPDLDVYGRRLALVFADGELLQTRIVREGQSAYYTLYGCAPSPVHESLLWAEAEARAFARGIWQSGHPTDYRVVLDKWIGSSKCRPNPFVSAYCP